MAFGPLGVNKYGDLTFISLIFIETQLYLYCFHNFEINIHNLLFLIKISVLIKSFKGQNLTVPPSSYYQCCKIDHVQRSS
jgi:hypothetical protein